MNEKSFKILIVDDDDVIREAYVQIFKQKGAEVLAAKDGVEGLDAATKETPDAIITGIIMPRMDGFQLIRALKENIQTRDIKIIILSHLGREEDRRKAQELGIENFIIQGSMTPNEIVGLVKNLTTTKKSFRLSFDAYALDAPRLAKTLPGESLNCPNCREKMLIEIQPKLESAGYNARLLCPKCEHSP